LKRSKLIISVMIALAVFFVISSDSLYCRQVEAAEKTDANSQKGDSVQKADDANEPEEKALEEPAAGAAEKEEISADANEPPERSMPDRGPRDFGRRRGQRRSPGDANDFRRGRGERREMSFGGFTDVNEPNDPNRPDKGLEALNLKDVQMKDVIKKLSEWTGKVVIPTDEAMEKKVTICSSKKVPRSYALLMIYAALRVKGIIAEESDGAIYLKPIKDAKLGSVPTISSEEPLAAIDNKNQIVQKFFKLKNYSPTRMGEIVRPLIGEYGYVSADENTNSLLVIDAVGNLIRIERIISQFDVPGYDEAVEEVFEIRYGDPRELVQLLKMLFSADERSRSSTSSSRDRGDRTRDRGRGGSSSSRAPSDRSTTTAAAATSVVISSSDIPIVFIPEPRHKWIIARASVEDMKQIRKWIAKLDREEPIGSEVEIVPVKYVDAREVATEIERSLQRMPGAELEPSVLVRPLPQAKQIMIFGRAGMREMVKKLIEEIDILTDEFETRVFKLKYADPDQIKTNIEGLYEARSGYQSSYGLGRYSSHSVSPEDVVKVISFPTLDQVTVIATPQNLDKIVEQIAEWDVPIDVNDVKPRIIELKNSDPIRMVELLTKLFTEEVDTRSRPWWFQFGGEEDKKKKIVGALYGQLTFEAVPDTKKIIVISNIPEAYDVVEALIKELDSREKADVPHVITLNYADAEDICDQLNAILNEPGTRATLRRSSRGLSELTTDSSGQVQSQAGQDTTESQDEIVPWWSGSGSRTRFGEEEMPISNIIGRIRFIPVHRSKAVLVLAPPEYMDDIEKMIKALDKPGKQVMVKAIIVQVNHTDLTSLGVKLAADPASFGGLSEGALTLLSQFAFQENRAPFETALPLAAARQGISTSFDLNVLVDLLIKEANGRVLNQPTLWTKDNEEAEFFRGQTLSFIEAGQTSAEGGSLTTQYTRTDVGLRLRVRPNITPEKNVDMTINLSVDQLEQETINTQPVTSKLDTTTHMIIEDTQTIMLGGILFQNESEIEQKIPLLGDLPLLGGMFRHYDILESNNELLVFITPYVIDEEIKSETKEQLEDAEKKLQDALRELGASVENN